jgi:NTP pyrophosphatase (non-canonical NTP hydrolase)
LINTGGLTPLAFPDRTHFLSSAYLLYRLTVPRVASGRRILGMTLGELQQRIRDLFGSKDSRRGVEGTFMWFMEEVGELAAALRDPASARDNLALEFADVLAWLATLANIAGVDLDAAVRQKYGAGCPKCGATPCICGTAKP